MTVSRPVESLRESWFFDLVCLGSLKPSPDVERTEQPYIPNMPIPVIHVLAALARERQDFFFLPFTFLSTHLIAIPLLQHCTFQYLPPTARG